MPGTAHPDEFTLTVHLASPRFFTAGHRPRGGAPCREEPLWAGAAVGRRTLTLLSSHTCFQNVKKNMQRDVRMILSPQTARGLTHGTPAHPGTTPGHRALVLPRVSARGGEHAVEGGPQAGNCNFPGSRGAVRATRGQWAGRGLGGRAQRSPGGSWPGWAAQGSRRHHAPGSRWAEDLCREFQQAREHPLPSARPRWRSPAPTSALRKRAEEQLAGEPAGGGRDGDLARLPPRARPALGQGERPSPRWVWSSSSSPVWGLGLHACGTRHRTRTRALAVAAPDLRSREPRPARRDADDGLEAPGAARSAARCRPGSGRGPWTETLAAAQTSGVPWTTAEEPRSQTHPAAVNKIKSSKKYPPCLRNAPERRGKARAHLLLSGQCVQLPPPSGDGKRPTQGCRAALISLTCFPGARSLPEESAVRWSRDSGRLQGG